MRWSCTLSPGASSSKESATSTMLYGGGLNDPELLLLDEPTATHFDREEWEW